MNREIKFRAWSDKFDKMIYDGIDDYTIDVHANTIWLDSIDDECPILMQFTGLTDKNGKEIYFDDILKTENGDKFHVTYHDIAPSMIFKGILCDTHHNIPYCIQKDYEIIGNIYENPELK